MKTREIIRAVAFWLAVGFAGAIVQALPYPPQTKMIGLLVITVVTMIGLLVWDELAKEANDGM